MIRGEEKSYDVIINKGKSLLRSNMLLKIANIQRDVNCLSCEMSSYESDKDITSLLN